MQLTSQQLNNLPVYTNSNLLLGRVSGFLLNSETHQINKYLVKKSNLVQDIIGVLAGDNNLVISASQIISLSKEKMIVEDNVALDREQENSKIKSQITAPASLAKIVEQ